MKKYYSLALFVLLFLAGCVATNIEDPSSLQNEGFKNYKQPDIYIEDALLSPSTVKKKHTVSEVGSKKPPNSKSGFEGLKSATLGLEWIPGPDRDTTWDQARAWVQNLSIDGGGWRMPTIKELKTLHQQGDTFLLSNTTGRWVWSNSTKGSFVWLFSFRYGIDKWDRPGQSENYRALAVRPRK